jgi:hypothetical protein
MFECPIRFVILRPLTREQASQQLLLRLQHDSLHRISEPAHVVFLGIV